MLCDFGARALIASVVIFVVRMPFHLYKAYSMLVHKADKLLPKIYILHFLFACGAPAVVHPFVKPTVFHGIAYICRITVNSHIALIF